MIMVIPQAFYGELKPVNRVVRCVHLSRVVLSWVESSANPLGVGGDSLRLSSVTSVKEINWFMLLSLSVCDVNDVFQDGVTAERYIFVDQLQVMGSNPTF